MRITRVSRKWYLLALAAFFSLEWALLALKPLDRKDWLIENLLVFAFVAFFALTFRKFPLSRFSMTLIFLFLCVHEIGAHYTYALVPYDEWAKNFFGFSLNGLVGWERNNFDRIVHFLYGFLLSYPLREVYLRISTARGFWGYFLPLDFTMSTSMIYELIEWLAALVFGGELGAAYLGSQGDVWDAQKDMLMATLGSLAAMSIIAGMNICLRKDFAAEWAESLRVKSNRPLGEDELRRVLKKREKG